MEYKLSRHLFTKGLALSFFLAFASSFVQYPGLFSQRGIASVQEANEDVGIFTTDEFMFALHVASMVLSICICLDVLFSPNLTLTLPLAYWWLLRVSRRTGTPFLNYQWDQLLVEAGTIGSLWVIKSGSDEPPANSVLWAIRFLAFKLMFSSGVVKLTADDPTWLDLRALHYHFASQPLPTPLAWYAEKLPDWMLRLGTAGSLFIEIPLALFILAPFPLPRLVVALLTTLLMLNIAVTGNYNFFNLLTVVLMIPLVNDEDLSHRKAPKQSMWRRLLNLLGTAISFGLLGWYTFSMFSFVWDKPRFPVTLRLTSAELNNQMNKYLPLTVIWSLAAIAFGTIRDIVHSWRYGDGHIFHLRVALGLLALIFVTMSSIPMLFSLMTNRQLLTSLFPQPLAHAYMSYGQEFTSSYGLFRVMTGVGRDGSVRVPTVLIKIALEGDESNYQTLAFRNYANEFAVPKFVQPHQPRLDWQMWFLSLAPSRASHETWFISFCKRLLEGEKSVFGLLAASEERFRGKISSIQAELTEFAFTTKLEDASWWQRLPTSSKDVIIFKTTKSRVVQKKPVVESPLMEVWIDYGRFIPMSLLVLVATARQTRLF